MTERRKRGVRLTDLDRTKVYRIGHTGRRWEVLGAEHGPESPGGCPVGVGRAQAPEARAPDGPSGASDAPPSNAPKGPSPDGAPESADSAGGAF